MQSSGVNASPWKYVIGNWKANKTINEAKTWIKEVKSREIKVSKSLEVALCPSFIHLHLFSEIYPQLALGCQDLSPFGDGAYTGKVTARMLTGLVKYVILGHSEQRRWFKETPNSVAQKALQAVDYDITPIIAVDQDNWTRQLNSLEEKVIKSTILMYEPPESISKQEGPIGKGKAAPLDQVKEMISAIKSKARFKAVIYGGSIKSHNISSFLKEDDIDGVLPGSASLNPEEWVEMLRLASASVENLEIHD